MVKVKAEVVGLDQGAGLLGVPTQDVPQRLIQQVGRGMVLFNLQVPSPVNYQLVAGPLLDWAGQFYPVQVLLVWRVLDVNDPANLFTVIIDNVTSIGYLAPHFSVEWCGIKDHFDVLVAWCCAIGLLTIVGQANYLGTVDRQIGIADVLAIFLEVGPKVGLHAHSVVHVTCVPGPVLLLSHRSFKALLVNRQALISCIFLRQFDWEAVGIVELERRPAIDLVTAVLLGISNHAV